MDDQEMRLRLKAMPTWSVTSGALRKLFQFQGFVEGIAFVNRVAVIAEEANHHPDIDIRWNKVTLSLTTHDKGGITEKDFSLAERCDASFSQSP